MPQCPRCSRRCPTSHALKQHLFHQHRVEAAKVNKLDAATSYAIRSRTGEGWDAIIDGKVASVGFITKDHAEDWIAEQ